MPRRRLSNEARERLARTQASLSALSKHPSWPDFEAEVERKSQRIEQHVLAVTLGAGVRAPVNEIDIYYWRGFIQGMRYLAAVPSGAETRLEDYLRRQGVQLEGANQ